MNKLKKMMDEIAMQVFEKYEMEMFTRLQAGKDVYLSDCYKNTRRELTDIGLTDSFAVLFLREQINDMEEQINKQRRSNLATDDTNQAGNNGVSVAAGI